MILNFAFNYGSRQEMTAAISKIALDIQNKKIEKIYKYQTKEIFLNKTSLRAGFVFRLVRVLI